MQKIFKLGVIGAGFMSSAIVSGVLRSGFIQKSQIIVSDISEERLALVKQLGVAITTDNKFLADNSEFVLFAVKPQNFTQVASQIKESVADKYISIMAGVSKQKIKDELGKVKVCRCMPNTPCSIGAGAIGIDALDFDESDDKSFIMNLFSPCGEVVFTEEKYLNAVTGISGSAPAYFYYIIRAMVESATKLGLNEDDAKRLAVATMIGSGKMIFENKEKSLDDLISAVCSKGGTTIEAIKSFDNDGLEKVVDNAINACVNRAEELEKL